MTEKAIEDCMQFFHRTQYKCEHKVKLVQEENGEEKAFLKNNILRIMNNPIGERNEEDVKSPKEEQRKNIFIFDIVVEVPKMEIGYNDMVVSSY